MHWLAKSLCALFIGVSTGSCALTEAERNNRGGFLDHIADDVWMKADSKKMRALRAIALEASLARIAMIAPKNAADRALLARRIGDTSKRADIVRKCAFSTQLIAGQRPDEPCFSFDSVMVDYENALFDLALIALPLEETKKLNRVSGGIASTAVNPLELVQTLLEIGREGFRYGRVVGAIYRDTLELEVQVWLASPEFASDQIARGVPEQFVVTADRVAGLAAAYDRGNDNVPAWRAEIAALRAQGLEPVPHQRFITQIFAVVGYFCGQIVTDKDPSYEECRQSKLMQGLPVGTGAARSLSGFGMSSGKTTTTTTITRPARASRDSASPGTSTTSKGTGTGTDPPARAGALTAVEREMSTLELTNYKQILCVRGGDATSDIFDMQTRQRLRDFEAGERWADEIMRTEPAPTIDRALERKLRDALVISGPCDADESPERHAYEAGVYVRRGRAAADTVMTRALGKLGLDTALRERRAIFALRTKAEEPTQSTATPSAQPTTVALTPRPHDQLDPALWKFIKRHGQAVGPRPPGRGS
jgi:hypothetical protein